MVIGWFAILPACESGSLWKNQDSPTSENLHLAAGPEIAVVGDAATVIVARNGKDRWARLPPPGPPSLRLRAAAHHQGQLFVGGDGVFVLGKDGAWLSSLEGASVRSLCSASSELLAVGDAGFAASWSVSAGWKTEATPSRVHLEALACDGGVWAAGRAGVVISRVAGGSWERLAGGPVADWGALLAVSGLLFGVGAREGVGVVARHNGEKWEHVRIEGPPLHAVAWAADTLWVVGERGSALRSSDQGETWFPELLPTDKTLRGVAATDDGRVVVVGDAGTLLVRH